ncbi:Major facilitator superfamily domain general substrate transporter [Penicillium coprophilum]|uniref:Major facilitator superfamily domain general substrate transporter n=1 Tax=Penicillium coprophilum TaxID=36646 RepID=UPI0023892DE4|nr:Major facilitator superfamily domain general substrate transporter [Penicillium coprophilum]KAJ5177995.1 Major facilitator superfamily domain general substrate transporter [Penicillium coprophilum]
MDEKHNRPPAPERFNLVKDVAMKDKALAMDKQIVNTNNKHPAAKEPIAALKFADQKTFYSTEGNFEASLDDSSNLIDHELPPVLNHSVTTCRLYNARSDLLSCNTFDSHDVKDILSMGHRPDINDLTKFSPGTVDSPHPVSPSQSLELTSSTEFSHIIPQSGSFLAPEPTILPELVKVPPINDYTQPVELCHGLEVPDSTDLSKTIDHSSPLAATSPGIRLGMVEIPPINKCTQPVDLCQRHELPYSTASPKAISPPVSVAVPNSTMTPAVNNYTQLIDPFQGLEVPVSTKIQEPPQIQQPLQQQEPLHPEVCTNEYQYRSTFGGSEETIHHWNWFGQPVYSSTATPPAVSLAFMQAKPKVPQGRDELRVSSILNRAIHYIDPVILKSDRENEAVLQMHGSAMIHACDGITYTHYSIHGSWIKDDFSKRKMTVPDIGVPLASQLFVVANGIHENGPFITRFEWMEWRDNLVSATQKPACAPRRLTWKATPSRFKIESIPSTDKQPAVNDPLSTRAPVVDCVSKAAQKAVQITKQITQTLVSCPIAVMGILKMNPPGGAIPQHSPCFTFGIVGVILRKAWTLIKTVFNPHGLLSNIFLSFNH